MRHQIWANQHNGHPVLQCCGSYGNLKAHKMFFEVWGYHLWHCAPPPQEHTVNSCNGIVSLVSSVIEVLDLGYTE